MRIRDTEPGKRLRKEIADWYRDVRKDNPAMARLLFRHFQARERSLLETILCGAPLIEFAK